MFSCGTLQRTTSGKSGFTCSFLFLMFCKNLGERRHSQLYHPTSYLSFPLCLSLLLSLLLSALPNHCLYSCLSPLQQKPLSGESQTHTLTHEHTLFPGSDMVQKVMILFHCSGNIYSSKTYHSLSKKGLFLFHSGLSCLSPAIKLYKFSFTPRLEIIRTNKPMCY